MDSETMDSGTMDSGTIIETRRVLIVDDVDDVRYLLSCAMESDGRFDVVGEASTARQALTLAETERPDVVLVDLFLVGKNSSWLLRRLRQALPDTRLIAVTGSSDTEVHARATVAGANAVLVKRDLTTTLLDKIFDAAK